jgi:membrane protease YdiL (CAAX protease family)
VNRQQAVTLAFATVGAGVLAFLLRVEPGSAAFVALTLGLAAVWTGGAILAGPVHLGRAGHGLAAGAVLAAVFTAGGLVVRGLAVLEPLESAVADVVTYADRGSVPLLLVVTVLNGLAEELFFRGAVVDALPRHRVALSTLAYVVATALTGNVMLAFAAIVLGTVTGHLRLATGGVLAPMLTHVTWSVTMLLVLPVIFAA